MFKGNGILDKKYINPFLKRNIQRNNIFSKVFVYFLWYTSPGFFNKNDFMGNVKMCYE